MPSMFRATSGSRRRSLGLLTSRDQGASWQGGPVLGMGEYLSVTVHGEVMAAARADGVVLSKDGGLTWWPMGLPTMLTRIRRILFSPDGTLWLGAREGVYFSEDQGKTWLWIDRLPFRDVDDLEYDSRSIAYWSVRAPTTRSSRSIRRR